MLTPSPCSNIVIYNIGMHPSIVYYIYIPSGVLCSLRGFLCLHIFNGRRPIGRGLVTLCDIVGGVINTTAGVAG